MWTFVHLIALIMNNPQNRVKQQFKSSLRQALNSRLAEHLCYPHGVDRYLEYLNPAWSLNEVKATVVARCSQTPDTVTVSLKPNSNWQGFKPGQYLRITISIDGALHTRCFSPRNRYTTPVATSNSPPNCMTKHWSPAICAMK